MKRECTTRASYVAKGTMMSAEEAGSWEELHNHYVVKRISHQDAYSLDALAQTGQRNFQPYAPRGNWSPSPYRLSLLATSGTK